MIYGYVSLEDGHRFQFDEPEIGRWKPVYATPQQKPLPEEEIKKIWGSYFSRGIEFARALEAAHGITGEQT